MPFVTSSAPFSSRLGSRSITPRRIPTRSERLAVCYARPFKRHGIGLRGDEWAPRDLAQRALHDRLIELRDAYYAHTDETDFRGVVDIGTLVGDDAMFSEAYTPMNLSVVPRISELRQAQSDRFLTAARTLERKLTRSL